MSAQSQRCVDQSLPARRSYAEARVRSCHPPAGKEYAVKIIDKKDFVKNASVVKQEIEILQAIGKHAHIVGLEDYYEGEDEYYIVTEL